MTDFIKSNPEFQDDSPIKYYWPWLWGIPVLRQQYVDETVSVCPACRNRVVIVISPTVFTYWCPSCRTDVRNPDVRVHYENPRKLLKSGPYGIVNCVA